MKILNIKVKTNLTNINYITSKLYLVKDKQKNFYLIPHREIYKYDDYKIIAFCYVHHPEILLDTWQNCLKDWCNSLIFKLRPGVELNKIITI